MFSYFWKIKGEGLNAKKSIYWHPYVLENSRKISIFFGYTTYREKKRREGRKKNWLVDHGHKSDKWS